MIFGTWDSVVIIDDYCFMERKSHGPSKQNYCCLFWNIVNVLTKRGIMVLNLIRRKGKCGDFYWKNPGIFELAFCRYYFGE